MIVHTAAKIDPSSTCNILMPLVVLVFNCHAWRGKRGGLEGWLQQRPQSELSAMCDLFVLRTIVFSCHTLEMPVSVLGIPLFLFLLVEAFSGDGMF